MPLKPPALPAIAIGAIYQGPELYRGPTELVVQYFASFLNTNVAFELSSRSGIVNVIVVAPGSLGSSNHVGLKFSDIIAVERRALLYLYLPQTFVRARHTNTNFMPDRDDPVWVRRLVTYLISSLRSAIAIAMEQFRLHKINFSAGESVSLLLAVARELGIPEAELRFEEDDLFPA